MEVFGLPRLREWISARITRHPGWSAMIMAMVAIPLCGIGVGVPGAWRDEAATGWVIQYSAAEITSMTEHIDLVLLVYYQLINVWTQLCGSSVLSLRMPSVLAIALGAAFLFDVGRRLLGADTAVVCGLVFVLLPRSMWAAIEARPYALVAMTCAVVLWIIVVYLRGGMLTPVFVASHVTSSVLAVHLHLHAVLAIAFLGFGALLLPESKGHRLALVISHLMAAGLCLPFIMATSQQTGQVSWVSSNPAFDSLAEQLLVDAFFPYRTAPQYMSDLQAQLRWVGLLAALLTWGVVLWALRGRLCRPVLALGGLPVLGMPVVLLIVGQVMGQSFILDRYFSCAVPCIALLLGCSLAAYLQSPGRTRWLLMVILLVCFSLLAFQQRTPLAKSWLDDHVLIAEVIQAHAQPGDGFVFGEGYFLETADGIDTGRNVLAVYPEPFHDLVDVSYPDREPLTYPWPPTADLPADEIPPMDRLWVVDVYLNPAPGIVEDLAATGWCHTGQEYLLTTHRVGLWSYCG